MTLDGADDLSVGNPQGCGLLSAASPSWANLFSCAFLSAHLPRAPGPGPGEEHSAQSLALRGASETLGERVQKGGREEPALHAVGSFYWCLLIYFCSHFLSCYFCFGARISCVLFFPPLKTIIFMIAVISFFKLQKHLKL